MKKLGGLKEICPTFSDCARVVKKNFPEKLSKIVVDGGRSDYEKFLLDSIFPTKLTEFVPFIFIISQYCPTVKRILPDLLFCQTNFFAPPPARYGHGGDNLLIIILFSKSCRRLSILSFIDFKWLRYP
jgi:hypothetical protein